MNKTFIAFAIFAILSIQTLACFGNLCPIRPIKQPIIPINQPFIHHPYIACPSPQVKPQRPPVCRDQPLSNKFTLSLSYICRPGVAFKSCQGKVVWNNAIIKSIIPCDHSFQTLNLQVTAQVGKNILQLEGAGISDSYGLLIDNVKLVRKGTNNNIVINGDFSNPNVGQSWGVFNDILGWQGKGIQIGNGKAAYGVAGHQQLCELDGYSNYQISQTFTFDYLFKQIGNKDDDDEDDRKTLKYNLEFDWAIRQSNTNPETSKANVFWNDNVIASLQAGCNKGVNHESIEVALRCGENVVQFEGTSFNDSYGITIDNVKLTSKFNNTNLIVNGDFSSPCVGSGWKTSQGGIPGWSAVLAEIGDGGNYNCQWRTGQVIELDSYSNQKYTQIVKISDSLFSQLLKQAKHIRCY